MSVLVGNARAVTAASFTPYGNTLVTGGADGTTRTWGYFAGGRTIRDRIVQGALLGAADADEIGYRQYRPMLGVSLKIRPPNVPSSEDSSSFVTWCYWQAGAPDPNGLGYNGAGFTGTMLAHMRRIPKSAVRPGDLVVWTPPATGRHVAIVVAGGPDPDLVSHGSDAGPTELPFSREEIFQRAFGSGTPVWLTEDLGR
jgi:cell wall-associated NlpC family hydrolase